MEEKFGELIPLPLYPTITFLFVFATLFLKFIDSNINIVSIRAVFY